MASIIQEAAPAIASFNKLVEKFDMKSKFEFDRADAATIHMLIERDEDAQKFKRAANRAGYNL